MYFRKRHKKAPDECELPPIFVSKKWEAVHMRVIMIL